MENLGREPSIVHGTMHGPGYSAAAGPSASHTLADGAKTPADIGGNTWVLNHGFFFILNLAVGGEWPGNPDSTTVFPQKMVIDYVRVCQR